MIITDTVREEIQADIARCETHTERKGSEALYGVLVAKYSVLDADFPKGLSTNGKLAAIDSEFDYRQELNAIAAKLKMWLMAFSSPNTGVAVLNTPKAKIHGFIKRGEEIRNSEYHPAQGGFPLSYVDGPKFDTWMGEINIFNERYLKMHPLYNSIHNTYFFYKKNLSSSCDDMLGHLRALASDDEFFKDIAAEADFSIFHKVKTVAQLLAEDIIRCQQYLSNQKDENIGKDLYFEITGRYDSIINDFGLGLYSYFPEWHFYDPDISISTINHNLKLLMQKMISYQAVHCSIPETVRKEPKVIMSNKVFIVHGHDTTTKLEVARTLEKSGFEAIILHEQPSAGNTVIEKIEANTDVAFAVVLYTPCDMGRAKEAKVDDERSRARQNVVFEHGYLIGKLGRKCVSALVKGSVETPGDISGIVYITMDDTGAWKMALAKEMKNSGLQVDMNKFCS